MIRSILLSFLGERAPGNTSLMSKMGKAYIKSGDGV